MAYVAICVRLLNMQILARWAKNVHRFTTSRLTFDQKKTGDNLCPRFLYCPCLAVPRRAPPCGAWTCPATPGGATPRAVSVVYTKVPLHAKKCALHRRRHDGSDVVLRRNGAIFGYIRRFRQWYIVGALIARERSTVSQFQRPHGVTDKRIAQCATITPSVPCKSDGTANDCAVYLGCRTVLSNRVSD